MSYGQGITKDSLTKTDMKMGIESQRYATVSAKHIAFQIKDVVDHVTNMIIGMEVNNQFLDFIRHNLVRQGPSQTLTP